jgi:hypothetical protein
MTPIKMITSEVKKAGIVPPLRSGLRDGIISKKNPAAAEKTHTCNQEAGSNFFPFFCQRLQQITRG